MLLFPTEYIRNEFTVAEKAQYKLSRTVEHKKPNEKPCRADCTPFALSPEINTFQSLISPKGSGTRDKIIGLQIDAFLVFTRYIRTSGYVVSGGPLQNGQLSRRSQRATDRYAGGYTPCPSAIQDSRTAVDSVGGITVCNEVLGEDRRAQNMKKATEKQL